MRKVKKRHVLIIELLIALMLISMCAFPLINTQIFTYKGDLASALKTLKRQEEANTFRELQWELYHNPEGNKMGLSWEEVKEMVSDEQSNKQPFYEQGMFKQGELEEVKVPLILKGFDDMKITFKREYHITAFQAKPNEWDFLKYPKDQRLLDVRINLYRPSEEKTKRYQNLKLEEKKELPSFLLVVGKAKK